MNYFTDTTNNKLTIVGNQLLIHTELGELEKLSGG